MMDEVDEAEALNVVAEHICMWYLPCNAMHRLQVHCGCPLSFVHGTWCSDSASK